MKYFETSAKHIFAVGDCIGRHSSTDRAYYEGLTLATNVANKQKNLLNYTGFIRQTNTFPEVATAGYTEDDLIKRDRKYKKAVIKLEEITASIARHVFRIVETPEQAVVDRLGIPDGICEIAGQLHLAVVA